MFDYYLTDIYHPRRFSSSPLPERQRLNPALTPSRAANKMLTLNQGIKDRASRFEYGKG